ncbi:unnamed protein product, partial [Brachionus calyciflorus]
NDNNTDDVPEWLKKDLEDADYIPINALEKSQINRENTSSHLEQKENTIKSLEEALRVIEELKDENFKLKEENSKLKEKLDSLNN